MKKKLLSLSLAVPMLFTATGIASAEKIQVSEKKSEPVQLVQQVNTSTVNSAPLVLKGEQPGNGQLNATNVTRKLVDTKWEYKGYALIDVYKGGWDYRNSITISKARNYTVGLSGYGLSGSVGVSYAFGETKNTKSNYLSNLGTFGEIWQAKRTYEKYLNGTGQYLGKEVHTSLEAWELVKLPVYDDNGWLWYDWPKDGTWHWAYNLTSNGLEYAKASRWK